MTVVIAEREKLIHRTAPRRRRRTYNQAIQVILAREVRFSLRGMGSVGSVIPTGIAAFAVGLILLANRPTLRVPIALLLSCLGFV